MGNTDDSGIWFKHVSVHPHACGEHGSRAPLTAFQTGSSPRLWGTQLTKDELELALRFIPTPVGNTAVMFRWSFPSPVHPHACGEHYESAAATFQSCGSSPRLWGTQLHHTWQRLIHRFIPTPVGNTPPAPSAPPLLPVHPHACGEHDAAWSWIACTCGSSPRLWGTQPGV